MVGLVALAGCKAGAGEKCAKPEDCGQGLTCLEYRCQDPAEKAAAEKAAAQARAKDCLSFEECELVCPDGGTMKTGDDTKEKYCEKNGKKHGPSTNWHDNGQMDTKGAFKNGKEHGPVTKWHDNGQVREKGAFKNGVWHGPFTSWHDNGQMETKGAFKNGKPHGPVTAWHENGQVKIKGTLKDGKLVSCEVGNCPESVGD